jgi:hypothetical protein
LHTLPGSLKPHHSASRLWGDTDGRQKSPLQLAAAEARFARQILNSYSALCTLNHSRDIEDHLISAPNA